MMTRIPEPGTFARECYAAFVFLHTATIAHFIISFPATLIPQLKEEGYPMDTNTESMLGSLSFVALGIAHFFNTIIVGKAGRKVLMRISIIVSTIGISIIALSPNIFTIYCGIIIVASSSSISSTIVICYVSETCRKEQRGFLLLGGQIMSIAGVAIVYVLHGFVQWRMMAALMILIALSAFAQSFFIPESKYWHMLQNDEEKAKKSLAWFQPTIGDAEMDKIIADMRRSIDEKLLETKSSPFLKFLRNLRRSSIHRPLVKAMALNFIRSGCGRSQIGINLISILHDLRIQWDFNMLTTLIGVAYMVTLIPIMYLVPKLRRKSASLLFSLVIIVSLGIVVVYKVLIDVDVFVPAEIPIIVLCAYMIFIGIYSVSLLPIITSEIQPAAFRAEANSVTDAVLSSVSIFYSFTFPYVRLLVPIEYIISYCAFNAVLIMLFIQFFIPETSKFEFYENENKKKVNTRGKNKCTT